MMLASEAPAVPMSTTFRAAANIADRQPVHRASAALWQDALFRQVTRLFAALVLGLLLSIIVALGYAALPALQKFGPAFFVTNVWNPVTGQFGALAPIYGMWGLFVFAPFFADHVQPLIQRVLGDVWIIGPLFQGAPTGLGVLTAGVILAVMVIPFIAAVMRDVF